MLRLDDVDGDIGAGARAALVELAARVSRARREFKSLDVDVGLPVVDWLMDVLTADIMANCCSRGTGRAPSSAVRGIRARVEKTLWYSFGAGTGVRLLVVEVGREVQLACAGPASVAARSRGAAIVVLAGVTGRLRGLVELVIVATDSRTEPARRLVPCA